MTDPPAKPTGESHPSDGSTTTPYLRHWQSRRDFFAGVAALAAGVILVATFIGARAPFWEDDASESYDVPCRDSLGSPLKAADLVRAFAPEGVTLYSLPESMYCTSSADRSAAYVTVADVSNRRSVTDDQDAVGRQGWITCTVLRGTRADRTKAFRYEVDLPPDSPIFNGTKSAFGVANLGCTLYPHGDNDTVRAQTQTVIRAFRRLDLIRQERAGRS